jgi:hypothetical protein
MVMLVIVCFCALSRAGIYPPVSEESVRIPELASKSSLVCKGEVIAAPVTKTYNGAGALPRHTGTATVAIDRCFKGNAEGLVRVLADEYLPGWGGGGHIFTPETGEYLLLFLTRRNKAFELANDNSGALPVSRLTSPAPLVDNVLVNLENDLKAGLSDNDPEMVLKQVLWLGCMGHLHSTEELHTLLVGADLLERAYLWEALLKLADISVLADAATDLQLNPPILRPFFLPRDRLLNMRFRVFRAVCNVRNPRAVPYLEHFTESPDPETRLFALMGLRAIGSLKSAPTFLRELDDHQQDMDFIAMQALIELAGGGQLDWYAGRFFTNPSYYAAMCRQWWRTAGEAKARVIAALQEGPANLSSHQ